MDHREVVTLARRPPGIKILCNVNLTCRARCDRAPWPGVILGWRAGEPVTGVPAPFAAHRVAGSMP